MSYNIGSPSPIQPLSLGNVVSAGLRLYRSHFKDYFLLALKAYVWLLVPFYGWAKFYALSALISRLAFGELVNQPESISSGQRFVNSRLGQFFLTILLMFFLILGIYLGVVILGVILGGILGFIFSLLGIPFDAIAQQGNAGVSVLYVVLAIIIIIAFLWLLMRYFLVEVPLAIEDNIDGRSTIARSKELTQGYVWRILLIYLVAFLITLPLQIIVQILPTIIQLIFAALVEQYPLVFSIFSTTVSLLNWILSFAGGPVVLPFWQTIKAVVYYDLRSRREGLGLRLRDHEI
ncbi:DUF975 domain-containing protein [Brasilonema octagenarum UFV-E1]|uniref:DUF975 domain-containing protein n=1 Tax=Brasilonema sennae CENA114 TaxID=415709 RepID=A0A856MKE5_9CYAN|nr:DUF975 domain-containing protein [Brasilonema sennae]QDL11022.1 DUF975 domain-containing protein [Brasilonema sennae CENA114]QDL17367.1 DUF975 domain-containing protein [Brasilonema octagenarum UFV-E1]